MLTESSEDTVVFTNKTHGHPPGFVNEALEIEKRGPASTPFERQDTAQIKNLSGLRESLCSGKPQIGKKVLPELIMRHHKPTTRKPIH